MRGSTKRESIYQSHNCVTIRVPEVQGKTLTMDGSTVSGSDMVVNQNLYIVRDSVTDIDLSNREVVIDGSKVFSNGRLAAKQGSGVSSGGIGTITVDVKLPSDQSSVRLETTSANLTVHGGLRALEIHPVSK
ncbi:hypothetical protein AB0M23_30300 [Streptomyces sp. NPDC052077]|uniref:hypothetical protein n=1 Tax=Streptomyces sp. NPDC052077 TaxID=3154757 RepID=UPI003427FD89